MGRKYKIFKKPETHDPYLIAAWPGIGNIGLLAVNYLKNGLGAEEFGEIEPWHFFFPKTISTEKGILQGMDFPASKFYYKKAERDLIIFLGEAQPGEEDVIYEIANSVLDVAEEFGCKRVYTAGAAVAPIHHTVKPRVWAVPNKKSLLEEVKGYRNTIVMSDLGEREGRGNITGLNGVLLGVARKRNLEGICLLGEIPMYIAHFPGPYTIMYPKASQSVLEALGYGLRIRIDTGDIKALADSVERKVEALYGSLPSEIREELDKLKHVGYVQPTEPGPITEEEKEKILKEVEEFFKKGEKYD
jgi:hypothetical protein